MELKEYMKKINKEEIINRNFQNKIKILDIYYIKYQYEITTTSHARGKLGDATKESLATFGNDGGAWYEDQANMVYLKYSWFLRGGNYGNANRSGIFNFFIRNYNNAFNNYSTRAILS